MLDMVMFGMFNLSLLCSAIAKVESDRGATSDNVYQIRNIYVDDVNRFSTDIHFNHADVYDKTKSEQMMRRYWLWYGKLFKVNTGLDPTYETLARIHNGGPYGWRKKSTLRYWMRVKKELLKELAKIGVSLDDNNKEFVFDSELFDAKVKAK